MKHAAMIVLIVFLLGALPLLGGCEGSDAEKAAQETVNELSGKNLIDKGEKIKQQIKDLSDKDIERIQQDIRNGTFGQEN